MTLDIFLLRQHILSLGGELFDFQETEEKPLAVLI